MATTQAAMATATAAQDTLARNLLSSVLALAFPDALTSSADVQQQFIAQAPTVRVMLAQHGVFARVTEGKALDKFQDLLFQLLDDASVAPEAKRAALEMLQIAAEQSPLEGLERLVPMLLERVTKMIKYLRDTRGVAAAACHLATALVCSMELYAPETRRELYDAFPKLLPAILLALPTTSPSSSSSSSNGHEHTNDDDDDKTERFIAGMRFFAELLAVSPNSVRSSVGKLEVAATRVFFDEALAMNQDAVASAAQCLARLAHASERCGQNWKQLVDRALELAHQQIDLVAGKRNTSPTTTTSLSSGKAWRLQDGALSTTTDLAARSGLYERAQGVQTRLEAVVSVLMALLRSRVVSEREVQLVISDIVALVRRVVTCRANEVGKSSALSTDGFRLPEAVVFGMLPALHAQALHLLSVLLARARLCALRHASRIARTLVLACETSLAYPALCEAVATTVSALGASSLVKMGQPLLEHLVSQCQLDLTQRNSKPMINKVPTGSSSSQPTTVPGSKPGKGKKRRRQAVDISQLSADAAAAASAFVSVHAQRVGSENVEAAVSAIATCVSVYGGLLPMATRALASDVTLQALALSSSASSSSSFASMKATMTLALLADTVVADADGAHATHLAASMAYWSSAAASSTSSSSSSSSWPSSPSALLLRMVALNASEALLHPRGPPLAINFESAIQSRVEAAKQSTAAAAGYRSHVSVATKTTTTTTVATVVRGALDWEKEETQEKKKEHDGDEMEEVETQEVVETSVSKRAKVETIDVEMKNVRVSVVEEEEEEEVEGDVGIVQGDDEAMEMQEDQEQQQEEDFEDERPSVVSRSTPVESDDDDDDEFPDIVVDDADDD